MTAAVLSRIVGQAPAVRTLDGARHRPVHAYLFEGPDGVVLEESARAFAAALLCPHGGDGTCESCVRVLHDGHPDVLVFEREGASISVDQARAILKAAMRTPVEGDRKVLILVDFHLVAGAAATLLKIIEEPPPSTVFVVLAEEVPPELVTIASRCVRVRFDALSVEQLQSVLINEGVDAAIAADAATVAAGRLGRARLLARDPEVTIRIEFWRSVPARLDGSGASVAVLSAEALAMLDHAAVGPLEERHAEELAALDARLEATGQKGTIGIRKELAERHKRELKRLRDDELRAGLAVISTAYQMALRDRPAALLFDSLTAIRELVAELPRNPNLGLAVQALFIRLTPLGR